MEYKKFFNSNPSVAGNSAVTNIQALQEMQLWLAGEEITSITSKQINDKVEVIFTKTNGETYTITFNLIKGEVGLQGLVCTTVLQLSFKPVIGTDVNYTIDTDFNRTPIIGEQFVSYIVNDNDLYVCTSIVNQITGKLAKSRINAVYAINTLEDVTLHFYKNVSYTKEKFNFLDSVTPDGNVANHFIQLTNNDASTFITLTICDSNLSPYTINTFFDKYGGILNASGVLNNKYVVTQILNNGNDIGIYYFYFR